MNKLMLIPLRRLFTAMIIGCARRTYFEARGQVAGALGAYHRAVVDVEGLIGRPLSALDAPNESQPNAKPESNPPTGAQP